MRYLVVGLGVVFTVIYIAANEIGKFIDDITPRDLDVGNDFEDMSNDRKTV